MADPSMANPPNVESPVATPPNAESSSECVMCATENPKLVLKFDKECKCPLVVCVRCGPDFVRSFERCAVCNLHKIKSFTFPDEPSDERFFICVCAGKSRSNWWKYQLEEKEIRKADEFYTANKQKNFNLFGFSQPTFDSLLNQEEKKQEPSAEYLGYFRKIWPDSERVENARQIDLNQYKHQLEIFGFQPPKKEGNRLRKWLSFFTK